jgi:hypothetical protein
VTAADLANKEVLQLMVDVEVDDLGLRVWLCLHLKSCGFRSMKGKMGPWHGSKLPDIRKINRLARKAWAYPLTPLVLVRQEFTRKDFKRHLEKSRRPEVSARFSLSPRATPKKIEVWTIIPRFSWRTRKMVHGVFEEVFGPPSDE